MKKLFQSTNKCTWS